MVRTHPRDDEPTHGPGTVVGNTTGMGEDAPRTGARQRRRGLYGPPPRLTRTSPLSGRLVWHIGDWGRASEHIGNRWEQVAGDLARQRLGDGDALVVLAATPTLMAAVLSTGLPHADAVRAWRENNHLVLEPLDFKWSLETASTRQVSRETLAHLLAAEVPPLQTALDDARRDVGLPVEAPVELHDGRFVAPVHPANHAALIAEPELPTLLLPVEPHPFFEALPGWSAARAVARLESSDIDRLKSIDSVERYYRLGAGVEGALVRLNTSIFDTDLQKVDATEAIARLRQTGRGRTLNGLLLYLQQGLADRKVLDERLAQLPRQAYPFGRLRTDLHRAGVPRTVLDSRGQLGRAYGEVTREIAAAMRAAGADLVRDGRTPEQALAELGSQNLRWAAIGATQAQAVAARLRVPAHGS